MRPFSVALLLASLASACGGIIDPSTNQVVPVSGTLDVLGSIEKTFSVGRNGEFNVKLTALAPDSDLYVGFSFGDLINNTCQYSPFYTNNFGRLNQTALSGRITRGSYCVAIFDSGTLRQSQTFTFEISHP
jgi:hypothetical protein